MLFCYEPLKGLATAMTVYTKDYNGRLPSENWCDLLIEEDDVSPKSFVCPGSDAIEGESAYAMNKHIAGMNRDDLPDDVVLLFETNMGRLNGSRNASIKIRRHYHFLTDRRNDQASYKQHYPHKDFLVFPDRFNQYGGVEDVFIRHQKGGQAGCNVVYVNGFVEFVTEDRIADMQWTAE